VTNRAIRLRVNVVLGSKLLAEFQLLLLAAGSPSQVGDLVDRTQVRLWIAMTIQAPSHRLILSLMHYFHLIDSTMATHAGDPAIDVRRVIEIHVIGQAVNTNPIDRLTRPPALTKRLELRRFRVNRRQLRSTISTRLWTVAVDASLRRGNLRMSRLIHRNVTVLAIHFQLTRMQRVAKWNRLQRSIAGVERLRAGDPKKQNARVRAAG